jgi:hypothetical protein
MVSSFAWPVPPGPAYFVAVMAHFPRHFQYFASGGNTRYEWDRSGPIAVPSRNTRKKGRFGTILSSSALFL